MICVLLLCLDYEKDNILGWLFNFHNQLIYKALFSFSSIIFVYWTLSATFENRHLILVAFSLICEPIDGEAIELGTAQFRGGRICNELFGLHQAEHIYQWHKSILSKKLSWFWVWNLLTPIQLCNYMDQCNETLLCCWISVFITKMDLRSRNYVCEKKKRKKTSQMDV